MMKKFSNTRGAGAETFGAIILVLVVVFVSIIIYNNTVKGSTKIVDCKAQGGTCTQGTCDISKQIPMLSDKAAGCNSGEICCKNVVTEPTVDKLCEGKADGDKCDKGYCTPGGHICLSLADYCSTIKAPPNNKLTCPVIAK